MDHLQERRMIEDLWDGNALTTEERDHLSLCEECQRQYATLTSLHDEFVVARLSHLRPETEFRLFSIIAQLRPDTQPGQAMHNLLGALSAWVKALPLWDSRQQAAAIGVRNGNLSTYRLLFGANATEVELMVEPQNGTRRLVGEVMAADTEKSNAIALIELVAASNAKLAFETESDAAGRFLLERVPPGTYAMTITPRFSQMVVIEPLELT